MKKILVIQFITIVFIFSSCQKQPKADFTVSKNHAYVGEIINFYNSSSDATSFTWDFGDGVTIESENAEHFYSKEGSFQVELTAYSEKGNKCDSKIVSIETVFVYETGSFIDNRDNKAYNTVKIGNQWWMSENLSYKDTVGNCWSYNGDQNNVNIYGYLYDWETACTISPDGWHLPNNSEWKVLINYLDGNAIAGGKLKESGFENWIYPNLGATNFSGFTALPGGCFAPNNSSLEIGEHCYFWSSTEDSFTDAYILTVNYDHKGAGLYHDTKGFGFSVRCVKD